MIHIYKNSNELAEELAKHIVSLIIETLKYKPVFTIALSGGSTPKSLYKILVKEPFSLQIDWKKIVVFWGDERFVPFEHEDNNARMAYDELLSHVSIPAENINRMNTTSSPESSAEEYEILLRSYFKTSETFDLVLLGMGDDGHTLSIFPGESFDDTKWVNALYIKSKQSWRITLTPALVNRSSEIIFMVSGNKKAGVFRQVIKNMETVKYPAQLIQPLNGNLHWFADEDAAALLDK